ncbi:hypothetical protein JTE90_025244 [Oedothorax gibbosus]|uniref:Uncharacterized protein n=1 Tax=Oedothorax gibbosus TaxID=931172 RepID=A0AAV6U3N6_9ARAC|nr:hypothetical protein JTE90_025244 [Oedothorax gibbosus]
MYHHTDTLSADGTSSFTKRKRDESHNRKRRHRKETRHSKNSKQPSRHSRSDKYKSDTKLKNSHLKNYDSEYIGPNRLTKHMGFLAKGKISDSISRLEELLPENVRARSKQDLRRILELNASTKTNGSGSAISYSRQHKDISSGEESNFEPVSYRSPGKHSAKSSNEKCEEKSGKSSVMKLKKALVSSAESRRSSEKRTPQQNQDEVSICREIITKKLHSTMASTNNLLFPNSSIQTSLLKELTDIKAEYQASQKAVSNSSNCESSQDNINSSLIIRQELMNIKGNYQASQKAVSNSSNCESSQDNINSSIIIRQELMNIKGNYQASQKVVSNSSNCESSQENIYPSCIEDSPGSNFKLNPVLTQDFPSPKKMENLFPVRQDYSSSSESEDEIYVDAQTLLRRQAVIEKTRPKNVDSKAESCSSGRDSSVILIRSSQSSNGSPVWAPKSSPVKFVPKFIPTPKLYFRQKMF